MCFIQWREGGQPNPAFGLVKALVKHWSNLVNLGQLWSNLVHSGQTSPNLKKRAPCHVLRVLKYGGLFLGQNGLARVASFRVPTLEKILGVKIGLWQFALLLRMVAWGSESWLTSIRHSWVNGYGDLGWRNIVFGVVCWWQSTIYAQGAGALIQFVGLMIVEKCDGWLESVYPTCGISGKDGSRTRLWHDCWCGETPFERGFSFFIWMRSWPWSCCCFCTLLSD